MPLHVCEVGRGSDGEARGQFAGHVDTEGRRVDFFNTNSPPPPPAHGVRGLAVLAVLPHDAGVSDDARGLGVAEERGAAVGAPPGGDEPWGHDLRPPPLDCGEEDLAGRLGDHGREGVCRVRGGACEALEAAVVRLGEVAGGEGVEDDAEKRDD